MKRFSLFLAALCLSTGFADADGWASAETFLGYRVEIGFLEGGGQSFLCLRHWTSYEGERSLVVDPFSLKTTVIASTGLQFHKADWHNLERLFTKGGNLPLYFRLRNDAAHRSDPLQNAGIRSWESGRRGAWLSFDLCPSELPLDRFVFNDLLTLQKRPLSVFLEVSGLWLQSHGVDWDWIRKQERSGALNVVWVNHTENHAYFPGLPLRKNFLLAPGTDFEREVAQVEMRLLSSEEMPSVFFRFPGLVSDRKLVEVALSEGLIPLGSSAWLNKDEALRNGSLVLTHANGNEPRGLRLLLEWAKNHAASIKTGEWAWLGLTDFL